MGIMGTHPQICNIHNDKPDYAQSYNEFWALLAWIGFNISNF